jgi:hypothetical protein
MFLFDDNLDNVPLESTSLERQGDIFFERGRKLIAAQVVSIVVN